MRVWHERLTPNPHLYSVRRARADETSLMSGYFQSVPDFVTNTGYLPQSEKAKVGGKKSPAQHKLYSARKIMEASET